MNRNRPIPKADRLPVLKPSTPEQQQRSLRHMVTADQQFKIGHYAGAALEYRRAIADAEDLPDNYFGLGFALAAQRRYDEAVQQWKYGLLLDSSWPTRGQTLTQLFGDNNQFEKTALLNRVADYVRQDPRSPDRIFLLGVLVHFDGDRENARTLFESAMRVAGNEQYLTAFLGTDKDQNVATAPGPKAQPPKPSLPATEPNNNSSIPAPPPANIQRPRTSVPPAQLSPQDAQPIPKREQPANPPAEAAPAEKFPDLQTPKLPVGGI
jgi:tetratricopeptide (TPR) repeat protein